MPTNMARYPANWTLFSTFVRFVRARGRCECTGQCGLHRSGRSDKRCLEMHNTPAKFARGRVILTTAHLCICDPPCNNPDHVIAACQRCHLRIDAAPKAAKRRKKAQDTTPNLPFI